MDISYIYTQKRREFGKPCKFVSDGPHLITNIEPDEKLKQEFYQIPCVSKEVDNSIRMCSQEVNTDSHSTENRGMNHTEGGWPASVDIADEDTMIRFRKKLDKDKNYVNSVKSLGSFLETFVMENNSIDVYEEYFPGECVISDEEQTLKTLCILSDPYKMYRKIVDLSWSLDFLRVAGAYSNSGLELSALELNYESYVWDIQNNVSPLCALTPEFSLNCVAFSPTELNFILGGYCNGQIGVWDIRIAGHAQQTSDVFESHSLKVSGVKWLETTSKMEVFSTSTDGTIMLWDIRNLSKPSEKITLDIKDSDLTNNDKTFHFSCAEYDPTLPTQFMVGTVEGKVLSFDKNFNEKPKVTYNTQFGPVLSVERNAFFPQLFATCDPWVTRIWSEGYDKSSILNILSRKGYYTDMAWSPLRPSLLYVTNTTGVIEVWDIPGKHNEPVKSFPIDKETLLSIKISDENGNIACGSISGKIYILETPKSFNSASNEEMGLVMDCIAGNENILGGESRLKRCNRLREAVALQEFEPEDANALENEELEKKKVNETNIEKDYDIRENETNQDNNDVPKGDETGS